MQSVIVGGHGAAAEVDPLAHVAIAHIGEMADLGAVAQHGVFQLHKIADAAMIAHLAVRAHIGEGPHGGVASDGTLVQLTGVDGGIVPYRTIPDHAVRADLAVPADMGTAPQDRPGQQRRTFPHSAAGINVGVDRIHYRDAGKNKTAQQQIAAQRHDLLQGGSVRHRKEGRGHAARGPDGGRICRTVRQRQSLRQAGTQQRRVSGIGGTGMLSDHRHHRFRYHHGIALCSLKRIVQSRKKGYVVYLFQRISSVFSPIFITNNKKPLNTTGTQLLAHPSDNGAKEHGMQHQRFHSGSSAGTAGAKINHSLSIIHRNDTPQRDVNNSSNG